MKDFIVGGYAVSKAGHDFGKPYVIIQIDNEYVYLVDGRIRTLERPKKKKMKHAVMLDYFDSSLADRLKSQQLRNEEVKRAIKLLQCRNSGKEVE